MRLVTFKPAGARSARLGALVAGGVFDLAAAAAAANVRGAAQLKEMVAFIASGDRAVAQARELMARLRPGGPGVYPLDQVRLVAPVPRPPKNVMCVGRNYLEHIKEGDRARGETRPSAPNEVPIFFTKPWTAIVGPEAGVIYPRVTQKLDYEAELAVVIGRPGRDIQRENAWGHVYGYTIVNDISARDLQRQHVQWLKGKGLDTFCPMGPWIVTADDLPDPHNLRIRMRINGETRQDATTADMIFDIPTILAELSKGMTLEPGDVIATGTPSGVGIGFDPPRFLKPGDVMEAEIEGIGVLRNTVRRQRS